MSVERLSDFALDASPPLGREFITLELAGYRGRRAPRELPALRQELRPL
jgi:hypothetical protein